MAAPVSTSDGFRADDPVRLLSEDEANVIVSRGGAFDFAIQPDGQRFVFVQDLSPSEPELAVLENRTETLQRP